MSEIPLSEKVRLEVYRSFVANGHPPVPAEIGATLGEDQADVESALADLHAAHLLVLAPGTPYVWMGNPFSALPTPFRVTAEGRRWWGNCIWDALGIVALLGGSGEVETWCPDCNERIEVRVRDGELEDPGAAVVHFAVPAAKWWDDIGFN